MNQLLTQVVAAHDGVTGVVGLALLTLGVCFHLFYLLAIALNLTILIWRTS